MKKLKLGAGVLLAGYLLGVGYVTFVRFAAHQKWRDDMRALEALAERELPTLKSATQLQALTTACAGKLPPRGHRAIIGYLDEGELPSDKSVVGQVTGFSADGEVRHVKMSTAAKEPSVNEYLGLALNPRYWWVRFPYVDPGLANYFVLTTPLNVSFPVMLVGQKDFEGGSAELRTRVLSLPDGKVFCEGTSAPTGPERIEIKGRGPDEITAEVRAKTKGNTDLAELFAKAIVYTPMLELCAAADDQFCKELTAMMQ